MSQSSSFKKWVKRRQIVPKLLVTHIVGLTGIHCNVRIDADKQVNVAVTRIAIYLQ